MGYLYDGWLKISERIIGGRRFEILIDINAAGAVVEDREGRLLVVRQYRPALMEESLEIPAGCIDKEGLGPAEIMAEELLEEAHLKVDAKDLQLLLTTYPQVGISAGTYWLYYYFYDQAGEDKAIEDDQDVTECLWLTKEQFGEKIRNGEIKDTKSQLAYYYLMARDQAACQQHNEKTSK